MIVIEGADNTGKSTLVRQFMELDPTLELLKRERFRPERGETIGQSYLRMLAHDRSNAIADRCLASECIYGRLFRNACRMSGQEHHLIRSALVKHRAIIIWCDPPDAVVQSTWAQREQLYNQDPLAIVKAYRNRIHAVFDPLPVIRYDWTAYDAVITRARIVEMHRLAVQQFEMDLTSTSSCG